MKEIFSIRTRVYALSVCILLVIANEVRYFLHQNWGAKIFFIALLFTLVSYWWMNWKDHQHMEEQKRLAEENPKHLINSDTGILYNRGSKTAISIGLMIIGTGFIIFGFQVHFWGYLFFGAFFGLIGAILLTVF